MKCISMDILHKTECEDLKYDVWKEFFPDKSFKCDNLKQKTVM